MQDAEIDSKRSKVLGYSLHQNEQSSGFKAQARHWGVTQIWTHAQNSPAQPQAFLIMRPHFLRSLPPLAAVITGLLVRQVLGYTQPL